MSEHLLFYPAYKNNAPRDLRLSLGALFIKRRVVIFMMNEKSDTRPENTELIPIRKEELEEIKLRHS